MARVPYSRQTTGFPEIVVEVHMAWTAMALCWLVAGLGAVGIASPAALIELARLFQTPIGLYAAAALRVIFGGALVLAAAGSRAPRVIRTIGVVVMVAGLSMPLIGLDRFRSMLEWWAVHDPVVMRVWAGVAIASGCTLAYALRPKSRSA